MIWHVSGQDAGLHGRDGERDRLTGMLHQAARGRGSTVVVSGPAGIGKTRLTEFAMEHASAHGFNVRHCEFTLLADDPLGPLMGMLERTDPLASTLAAGRSASVVERTPQRSLFTITAPVAHTRLLDHLGRSAATLASQGPALLVVEDAHWGTLTTFAALAELQRRASQGCLVLLVTTRTPVAPATRQGHAALLEAGATELRLGPLGEVAVERLVEHLVGAPPGTSLRRSIDDTGGNPLFVSEMVRGLHLEGALSVVDGRVESDAGAVPSSLAEQVRRRLDDLGADARELLHTGAVLGSGFRVEELQWATGRTATSLLAPLDELLRSGLLEDAGESLVFRHELVRSVVYDDIPASVRLAVHRQVAETLQGNGASVHRVAAHYARGALAGDQNAVDAMHAAARDLLATASADALELLDRALEFEPSPRRRVELLLDRLQALAFGGRLDEAEALARELLHVVEDPRRLLDLELDLGRILLISNRPGDALEFFEAAAREPSARTMALAEASLAALVAGDAIRSEQLADAAAAEPERTPVARSLVLSMQSRAACHHLDLPRSRSLAEEAVRAADGSEHLEGHRYQPHYFLCSTLFDLDLCDEALRCAATGRAVAERLGHSFGVPVYDAVDGLIHLKAGDLRRAIAAADEAIASCERTGSFLALSLGEAVRALVLVHLRRLDAARDAAARCASALDENPPLLGSDVAMLASALVKEAGGDPVGAGDELAAATELFRSIGLPHMAAVFVVHLARLAAATHRPSAGAGALEIVDEMASALDTPGWRGAALEVRGHLEREPALLVEAAEWYGRSPRRMDRARALEAAADVAADLGDDEASQQWYLRTIALYDACGATRDHDRAAAALRGVGGSVPPPRVNRGDDPLSTREREIATLVRDGMTNTEIAHALYVSRRTVESHLRRVFHKLDLSSRVELALWLDANER